MSASISGELLDLFAEPALGVVSYTTVAGQIVPFPVWVDYDGTHLLASSPMGSKKGRALRVRPQVGVVIVSAKTPWGWLSLSGRVVEIRPDEGLAFIDRMSQKYTGQAYERRTPREVFVIELDRVGHSGSWRCPTGSKWGGLFVLPASCSARPRHLIREWTTTQADWMLFDTATLTRCRLNVRTGIANGVFITRAVVGSHEPCRYASS